MQQEWKEILKAASIGRIMEAAYREHVLVPAFNIAYLPMVKTIFDVLKETCTFALLEVSRPDIMRFGAESFKAVKEEYARWEDPSLARLHQDHVPVIDEEGNLVNWKELIQEALLLGYHSVMIDGSRLPFQENVRVTQEVVSMAHPRGVCVEAELGAVLGHEKGPLPPYEELFASGKGFTSPEDAEKFVKVTGVDWLSIAIGNIHGAISGAAKDQKKVEARLNIEWLKEIARRTQIPLVLHGGSGIRKEYVQEAIRNGITKINVGTEIRQAYEKGLKEGGNIESARSILKDKLFELIEEYYEIQGTALKLAEALKEVS
ncbi:MAG: tagatose 1,6-diphosphate aldolase GatY/KbaY [Candidatus Atribacteria bacterium]|uniref:Class II fructose-bisphosphate aldolase n=1 Tax=Thermatribacter velox TaxID=3039681 RepID=A0ABZ2YDF7_9BACT|nr:tagatose 1,6-diphosphate aldolase GatY/KbaY [Candidatus Atribacteria bacterium]MDI3531624.1 tagatose 1,6-diphosphate aldolase GatY/KbaY [Candidatus Atribacteria bacterium]